ncbi:glutamine--fructose-6-phosphate transaminase (isomerizing) [Mycolicibacterium litorale]|uniref:Glutamine--fructose-6-phosphate aminotransferase [isomerizing] n=1 Tax=Mycolicibacterium litorale TaxID=758802 RepID=A0AAD1MXB1_9MYCO|nr:glutamine--fructose-6-phosphate transaminase (isomerizing) [Mycolicibacterium litorale]MCV7418108.1 glutamine--fructose-6-phosphate transaminase (isomerizing) [Mycolicibacterium litorale]TDY06504.1 glutamine--fructose-6-phosphate transaminase [Mycolicibacterium litorale]BBY19351.1 glutamine--fructose-6-phosphate aminotransferase [isomerizing] [Mycolicibacterium litorale]
MCGIVACRTSRPAVEYLRVALRRLEYRGYDSVGVALRTVTGDVARLRTTGRINALDQLVDQWAGTRLDGAGLGHTRWATHGAVTEANAHPHTDCTGRITLVHNGIVENADELRDELRAGGHRFATSVDSEVLCHLVEHARARCGDLFEAVELALSRVKGSWALAAMEAQAGRIVVAANGSPLLVAHAPHGDFAASDIGAIAEWVDEYRVLDDGDVVELAASGRWSRRGGVAGQRPAAIKCTWHACDADRAGYADFMAKEIDEQPEAVSRVLDQLGGGIATGELWAGLGLPPFTRLRVIGCGTSLNAGQVIGHAVRRLGGIPTAITVASEAAEEIPDASQLCLAISQSGETADVLHAMESTAVSGSPVVALTNNPHATLARRAHAVVECAAGTEIGVAATKTFVCQIVAGVALMISALVATNRLASATANRLVDDLRRLPDQLFAAATVAKCVVPPIVDQVGTATGFIFLSRGAGLPYAAEGALKLKELSYRWAEHYPAGELKHGPLALISTGTPVVVIDNGDPKLALNMAEVRARGGHVVSIGPAGCDVPLADIRQQPWGPLESAVPLQIFARNLALALGRDVDKPRNLAKSVTVE